LLVLVMAAAPLHAQENAKNKLPKPLPKKVVAAWTEAGA
jgi:hypothetical protein